MPNKRVHPVDSDATMDHNYPTKYKMLEPGNNPYPYPYPHPPHPYPPQYQPPPRNRSGASRCLRCLFCCYCCLTLLLVILAFVILFAIRVYMPQVPNYEVESFATTKFEVGPNSTIDAEFAVTIKADNPNGKLGFTYGSGSSIEIDYEITTLCNGTFPTFHQDPFNVTLVKVDLKGHNQLFSGLEETFMEEKRQGQIPLVVRVRVPMSVQGGGYSTMELTVGAVCSMLVDNLDPKKETKILTHTCFPFIGW